MPNNSKTSESAVAERPEIKKVIRYYYGFNVFITLLLWVPVFYTYQINHGLSDKQYFSIQSLYYLMFCFLEIPTGYIADRWGYRLSLKGAAFFMMITNISAMMSQRLG